MEEDTSYSLLIGLQYPKTAYGGHNLLIYHICPVPLFVPSYN